MLTKFTKFSLFTSLLLNLISCDYASEVIEMNQDIKTYQCESQVRINSINKGINQCTYTINYTIEGYFDKIGMFEITLKNATKTYTKQTKELNLKKGTHEIVIQLDQCVFEDSVTKSCFLVYK